MFWTVVGALLFGAGCGFVDPRPLYSVEIAQAVSGLVHLPPQAPLGLHNGRVFSIFIDAAALLLRAGVSEGVLCRLLSMLMSAGSCAAVTVVAYAFTTNRLVALAAPVVVLSGIVTPKALITSKYGFAFLVAGADLAVNGFSTALLVLSSVALWPALGAWLLPIAVAAHVSWGLAVCSIVAAGCVWDHALRVNLRRYWRRTALSAAMVAALWQLHQWWVAPSLQTAQFDPRYVTAVISSWDSHRAPLLAPETSLLRILQLFIFEAAVLAVAGIALAVRPPVLERVRFWIAGQAVLTILVSGIVIADELHPAWGPLWLHGLMASRWLNLNIILLPLIVTALFIHVADVRSWTPVRTRLVTACILCAMAGALGFKLIYRSHLDLWGPHQQFFDRVGRRPGLFIVGGQIDNSEFIQLRTRRPPLFDWRLLDTIPYAPVMGGPVEDILIDVYGVSLLSPENWAAFDQVEERWRSRTPEEWRALRNKYDVTDIIVPRAWTLRLPKVEESPALALYTIPE